MHTKNHETPKGRGSSLTIKLESESNGFNAWVRCASGNVLSCPTFSKLTDSFDQYADVHTIALCFHPSTQYKIHVILLDFQSFHFQMHYKCTWVKREGDTFRAQSGIDVFDI